VANSSFLEDLNAQSMKFLVGLQLTVTPIVSVGGRLPSGVVYETYLVQ
jgi:hypothetical protein